METLIALIILLAYIIGVPVVDGWCKTTQGEMSSICAISWPLWVPFWFLVRFVFEPLWRLGERLSLLVILAVASTATPIHAGNCQPFFYKHHAVAVVAPVYAAPVYYQAGRDIEADAIAAKVAKIVVGQLKAELKTAAPQGLLDANRGTNAATIQSAIAQHCAKCHSGAAPKGGIVLDGITELACSQITASLRAIADDSMPKDHKIAAEVKGQLMQELLALEAADRPQAVTVEKPEQTGRLDE